MKIIFQWSVAIVGAMFLTVILHEMVAAVFLPNDFLPVQTRRGFGPDEVSFGYVRWRVEELPWLARTYMLDWSDATVSWLHRIVWVMELLVGVLVARALARGLKAR